MGRGRKKKKVLCASGLLYLFSAWVPFHLMSLDAAGAQPQSKPTHPPPTLSAGSANPREEKKKVDLKLIDRQGSQLKIGVKPSMSSAYVNNRWHSFSLMDSVLEFHLPRKCQLRLLPPSRLQSQSPAFLFKHRCGALELQSEQHTCRMVKQLSGSPHRKDVQVSALVLPVFIERWVWCLFNRWTRCIWQSWHFSGGLYVTECFHSQWISN